MWFSEKPNKCAVIPSSRSTGPPERQVLNVSCSHVSFLLAPSKCHIMSVIHFIFFKMKEYLSTTCHQFLIDWLASVWGNYYWSGKPKGCSSWPQSVSHCFHCSQCCLIYVLHSWSFFIHCHHSESLSVIWRGTLPCYWWLWCWHSFSGLSKFQL